MLDVLNGKMILFRLYVVNAFGQTPLHCAASSGSSAVVQEKQHPTGDVSLHQCIKSLGAMDGRNLTYSNCLFGMLLDHA